MSEVVEAIAETEVSDQPVTDENPHDFDIEQASDDIAADLFGLEKDEDNSETIEEVDEEGAEGSGEKEEESGQVDEEQGEEEVEKNPAPQSWAKDTHELWDSMTKEQQDQVILRETQMKEGIDVRKEDADLGMKVRDAFKPFDNVLKTNNIDPIAASQRMMATHFKLVSAPLEERKQLFSQLAQSYGITQGEPDEETGKLMNNPFVKNLMNKVSQLEQNVNATQEISLQERKSSIEKKVAAFAEGNPHFNDLEDETARLITAGYELEDAYRIAYRASPYFEKDLEKQREEKQKETEKAKKLEAEKAKKAKSVNVKSRDTRKAPTAPLGAMEDTMHDIYREIQNRN